jgi:hypothetical protein
MDDMMAAEDLSTEKLTDIAEEAYVLRRRRRLPRGEPDAPLLAKT